MCHLQTSDSLDRSNYQRRLYVMNLGMIAMMVLVIRVIIDADDDGNDDCRLVIVM